MTTRHPVSDSTTHSKLDTINTSVTGSTIPEGWIVVHKFGRSDLVDNGSIMTMCDFLAKDTLYTYPPAGGLAMTLQSAVAGDIDLTYSIEGLAADGSIQSLECITNGADGTTPVACGTWRRVFRMTNITLGESPSAGAVSMKNGGITYAQAAAAFQQSMMALYTVPLGYTGYICGWTFNVPSTKTISASGWARLVGGTFTQKTAASGLVGTHLNETVCNLERPGFGYEFPELADMEVRGISSNAAQTLEVDFHVVLVPNA